MLIGLGFGMWCVAQTQPASESGIYRQEGLASWYGPPYDGKPTHSGEIFDSTKFTAAHPTLPFGTILTVTNLQNNKQVIVRINDRGPFTPSRIIDVSKAAAEQLDMIVTGTAKVMIESRGSVVSIATPQSASPQGQTVPPSGGTDALKTDAGMPTSGNTVIGLEEFRTPPYSVTPVRSSPAEIKPAVPPAGTDKRYRIQVGAYRVLRNATEVFDRLKNIGLNPAYERNGEIYRVVLAGVKADDVQLIAEKLGGAGFQEALIREEP